MLRTAVLFDCIGDAFQKLLYTLAMIPLLKRASFAKYQYCACNGYQHWQRRNQEFGDCHVAQILKWLLVQYLLGQLW